MQNCVCRELIEEKYSYEFEWHNFLYGGLAGLGCMFLVVILYQLVCYRGKQRSDSFELEMT